MFPCHLIVLFLKPILPTNLFCFTIFFLQLLFHSQTHTTHAHTTHANVPISVYKQREREAREARQLDREIRAQERHYQAETKKKEAAELHKQHQLEKAHSTAHSSQPPPIQKGLSTERSTSSTPPPPPVTHSPRDSTERSTTDGKLRLPSIDKDKLGTTSGQCCSTTSTTAEGVKIDSVKVKQANYRHSPTMVSVYDVLVVPLLVRLMSKLLTDAQIACLICST